MDGEEKCYAEQNGANEYGQLERIRTTRVSKANHELSLWLDEPGVLARSL